MSKLAWEPEAEQALARAPFFVRPLARRKVEERVRQRGGDRVTLGDVREAEARSQAVAAGKPPGELERMMPQANQPGAEMIVAECCHAQLSGCPNLLLDAAPWKEAVDAWARESGVSERLRHRVEGGRVLFHHKLRIALAGCPNGCSRPQIADVGAVGFVAPTLDPERCTGCGACEAVCPDAAITVTDGLAHFDLATCQGCRRCSTTCPSEAIALSAPAARILVGGKLGRHPHLADTAGVAHSPAEFVAFLDRVVSEFLKRAEPGERFADFWLRTHRAESNGGAQ
jgi:dissimilatory sulfite reductase (desulfoviridin) alpha/beta subunit